MSCCPFIKRPLQLLLCLPLLLSCQASSSSPSSYPFVPFKWLDVPPETALRLCAEAAAPDNAPDKINITCALEGESFAPDTPVTPSELVVAAYNIERGHNASRQVDRFLDPATPTPDVLLLSEVDRGCARTGGQHIARYYAKRLGMNYIYAVEFVELTQEAAGTHSAECEHGNAILSRFPLGNATQLRHSAQTSWFQSDEPRLGGRVALSADVQVGDTLVHLYSVHFESSLAEEPRSQQAHEIATHGLSRPYTVIVGGDFNSGYLSVGLTLGGELDQTLASFTAAGYHDAHSALSPAERVTAPENDFILDVLVSSPGRLINPVVGPSEHWDALSDHRPIQATLRLP
jgi:endonuclease/exonuclease/phosphatase family metal-dependent hydrolase